MVLPSVTMRSCSVPGSSGASVRVTPSGEGLAASARRTAIIGGAVAKGAGAGGCDAAQMVDPVAAPADVTLTRPSAPSDPASDGTN